MSTRPLTHGAFFDYYTLAEDLVNGRILEEDEASIVCESVESQFNEAGEWEGEYTSDEGVVITYVIEPATVSTDDGDTLTRQPDGSYTGSEQSWTNWKELREFTTQRPKYSGWHDLVWEFGDSPAKVYLRVSPEDGAICWGRDETDDPESIELDIVRPQQIKFRKIQD